MGSEADVDPSSTPKLSLYSLPSKPKPLVPPGSLTPPLHTVASIPFHWEEVPGKARAVSVTTLPTTCNHHKSRAARCLDLPPPPRMLLTDESSTVTSPKTVLEGPYNNNEGRRSFSLMDDKIRESSSRERSLRFSSWRWGSFKDSRGASVGSFDFSSDSNKVKMIRVRRRSSFLSFPNSSLVASIYGSLKQAVPWRRRN